MQLRRLFAGASLWVLAPALMAQPVADSFIRPVDSYTNLSQGVGEWYAVKCGNHLGIDLSNPAGTPVRAIANGVIRKAEPVETLGYAVNIEHPPRPGDQTVVSVYYHLRKSDCPGIKLFRPGNLVSKGDVVGCLSGEPEDYNYSAPHLHFGIRYGGYEWDLDYARTNKWFYPGYSAIYTRPRDKTARECNRDDPRHSQVTADWEQDPLAYIDARLAPPPPSCPPGITPISSPTAEYISSTSVLPVTVPDNTVITSVTNGIQTVTFSIPLAAGTVPTTWATWNTPPNTESSTPRVLMTNGATNVTLTLAVPASVFGLEVEPNPFSVHTITATFMSGSTIIGTVAQSVDGVAGALLAAGSSDQPITSVQLSSDVDFAIAQIRSGSAQLQALCR